MDGSSAEFTPKEIPQEPKKLRLPVDASLKKLFEINKDVEATITSTSETESLSSQDLYRTLLASTEMRAGMISGVINELPDVKKANLPGIDVSFIKKNPDDSTEETLPFHYTFDNDTKKSRFYFEDEELVFDETVKAGLPEDMSDVDAIMAYQKKVIAERAKLENYQKLLAATLSDATDLEIIEFSEPTNQDTTDM